MRSLWKISTGAWDAFQRSRQLPLNPWVCYRSRTFSSGEIVDRIGADGGRPAELMRIVTSAIYGLVGGSAAFRCRDFAGPGDGSQLRGGPSQSKSLLETAFRLDLWRRILASPSRLRPALDRRKYRALVWAGKVWADKAQLTARRPPGSSTTPAGAVGSSPRSQALAPEISETDILARGRRPLASTRARPSRLARLRGACWMSWGHQHRKSRATQRD